MCWILFLLVLAIPDDGCRRCEYRGTVPCDNHGKFLEQERAVGFCSAAAACEACAGGLLVDCKHCDGGPGSAELTRRQRSVAAWRQPTPVERRLGHGVLRVETEHFHLVVETGVLPEGRKKVDPHTLIHRVAEDVEVVASGLAEHFEVRPGDYRSKMRMWIWDNPQTHQEVMREFLGSASTGDFKMLGKEPKFSVWTEPGFVEDVAAVRSLFAHNAAHMLLSNLVRELWIGDLGGGWLDAAVGHYYEYRLFDRTVQYCIEEATLSENYANGQWRSSIRKRLERESEPFLPRLVQTNTGGLAQRDQALCWSFFDFLVENHRAALRPLLEDLKAKKPVREALGARLGSGLLELDARWRAWVAEVYPSKGDVPRLPQER